MAANAQSLPADAPSDAANDGTHALVVFGRDHAGKAHASAFAAGEAALAARAAELMGLRTLAVRTDLERALAARFPRGRVTDTCEAGAIAALNDHLRRSLATAMPTGGTLVLTAGIVALGRERQRAIFDAMAAFDGFAPDDDPYGEHDFGTLEAAGERVFWKIDAYDRAGRYASRDPADPSVTRRVLTVMLAGEY